MGLSLGHNAWTLPAVNALTAAEGKLPANERMLQDALRRAVNAKSGITMLVLHAANLPDAAIRPHRAKLARAVLDDAAEQVEGEVYRLTNGDLVLVARRPGDRLGAAGLAGTLGRLFDHPPADCLRYVSCWPLDQSAADATAYVASRLADAAERPKVLASLPPALGDWPGALLSAGQVWDLLTRQTAVHLPDPSPNRPSLFVPLHHALSFSVGMLQSRAPVAAVDIDRCMARHLSSGLEPALLAQLATALARLIPARAATDRAATDRAASFADLARTAPVFLTVGLRALASADFVALVRACHQAAHRGGGGPWLGVEIPWVEIVADPGLFARVRTLLQDHDVPWALSALTHGGLLLGAPQRLAPDLFKLEWSPSLNADSDDRRADTDAALQACGPARIILNGADSEAAIRWGVASGIRRFQGPHVENILAAGRMLGCPQARQCTVSQCSQRATAVTAAGRAGCLRPDLLDGGIAEPSEVTA